MILRLYFELGAKYPKMWLTTCSWFKILDHNIYFETPGDHADEMETSLMMYLKPNLIRPLAEAGSGHEHKSKISAMQEAGFGQEDLGLKSQKTQVLEIQVMHLQKKELFFLMKLQQNWRLCTLRFVKLM